MNAPPLTSQPKRDEDSYRHREDAHPVANSRRTDASNRPSESPQGFSAHETLSDELPPKYTLTSSVSLPGYAQDSGTVPFSPPLYMPAPSSHQKPLYSHALDSEHERALKFCAENPVSSPRMLMDSEVKQWGCRHFGINCPLPTVSPSLVMSSTSTSSGGFFRGLKGKAKVSSSRAPEVTPDKRDGTIYIRTKPKSTDMTFTTSLPMFSPQLRLRRSLVYYEITIMAADGGVEDSCVAIGFLTMPYPVATRLPGWHRCSIAVHSDGGRRYVADPLSGRDFLGEPVRVGDTVGVGMDFNGGNVFVTKNGRSVGGWSMFEELSGANVHDGQMHRFYIVGVFGTRF
ncbi:hypothetical protein V1517DRAFT_326327 [Lipomyces orientalis]|uniref:Uncharacterized protein n=1 Tax=Lipomyces orientalis TaxID=1233043 RepID=A0ACC3TLI1_9ASCO